MRRFITALVVGCSLAMFSVGTASAWGNGNGRPFRGSASGTVTQYSPHGITFDGTGLATDLGRMSIHMTGSWLALPTAYDGTGQLTAANGDQLSVTFIWDFDGHIDITVTGGTGRFQSVTGGAEGTIVIGASTGTYTRSASMMFYGTLNAQDGHHTQGSGHCNSHAT